MTVSRNLLPSRHRTGMTLLELTVVILVLLTLITVMFVGVHAWKTGANRTTCILNIRTVQMAVRGYGNINGLEPGQATSTPLKDELIGDDKRIAADPDCPGGGAHSFAGNTPPLYIDLLTLVDLGTRSYGPWELVRRGPETGPFLPTLENDIPSKPSRLIPSKRRTASSLASP